MEKLELQRIEANLEAIKKLMVLGLVQKGFKQKQIASLLGVGEATLSEAFPKGLLREAARLGSDDD